MRARALHAFDTVECLAQEDGVRIVVAAMQRGGYGPAESDRGAQQHRKTDAAVVARAPAQESIRAPPWCKQRDERDVEQHDRALDQDAEPDRAARNRDAARRARLDEVEDAVGREQHTGRQQHIEHDRIGERREIDRAEQHPYRDARRGRRRSQAPRQAMQQGQTGERAQQGHRARRPRMHTGERPTGVDQPEQQRWLVRVGRAVEVWNDELTGLAHLPRDREVTGLVDRQRRQQEDRRQQQCDRDQQRPVDEIAPGRRSGAGR